MKLQFPKYLLMLSALMAPAIAKAEIPLDYYASAQGLSGQQLKTAIFHIIGDNPDITMLDYGSGNMKTWWGFYLTDRNEDDNSVVDRYSNDTRYFGKRGSSVSGMNIEHSFPKSWWGGDEVNGYKDLFNLMPCEQKINSTKSNYPMGKVTNTTAAGDNGCTRVGSGDWEGNWWEPADKWKGDFARGYMYMATAYQDYTFSNSQGKKILQTGPYPTLIKRASDLYIAWAKADDVTEMETVRNDRVQSIQGNRNPFVDFPNLMEYIWGDSLGEPFDLRFTRKSARTTGSVGEPSERRTAYENTLLGDTGGFTIETIETPANDRTVWVNDATYGWKASAFFSQATPCVVDLVSPEIDLTDFTSATMTFRHAVKFSDDPASELQVLLRDASGDTHTLDAAGDTHTLDVPQWPAGNSWNFSDSGPVNLNSHVGGKVQIIFRYTSTSANACTWEINTLLITGNASLSGVEALPALDPDDNIHQPALWYSIDGLPIDPATYRGIAIRRQGTHTSKHLLR